MPYTTKHIDKSFLWASTANCFVNTMDLMRRPLRTVGIGDLGNGDVRTMEHGAVWPGRGQYETIAGWAMSPRGFHEDNSVGRVDYADNWDAMDPSTSQSHVWWRPNHSDYTISPATSASLGLHTSQPSVGDSLGFPVLCDLQPVYFNEGPGHGPSLSSVNDKHKHAHSRWDTNPTPAVPMHQEYSPPVWTAAPTPPTSANGELASTIWTSDSTPRPLSLEQPRSDPEDQSGGRCPKRRNDVTRERRISDRNKYQPKKLTAGRRTSEAVKQNGSASSQTVLERNRLAANNCRQRQRKMEEQLSSDMNAMEDLNRDLHKVFNDLTDEVLSLKMQLLQHAHCSSELIQRYINKTAEDHIQALRRDLPHTVLATPRMPRPSPSLEYY